MREGGVRGGRKGANTDRPENDLLPSPPPSPPPLLLIVLAIGNGSASTA